MLLDIAYGTLERVTTSTESSMVPTATGPLISARQLQRVLGTPDSYHDGPTVLDVRWRLGAPSARPDYLAGHLPGAVFVELDQDICGPPVGPGGRHPLPDPARLQEALRAAGVRAGRPVVVYDDGDGLPAARTWWTLRWAGLTEVAVLDGGFKAWQAAGGPVVTNAPTPEPGDVLVRPGGMPVLDATAAAALSTPGSPGGVRGVLLDVRAAERYRGETEPLDPVAGHIPGAVNAPKTATTHPDGRLLPAAQLREFYALRGVHDGTPVGAYCGSGVTAAHTALALTVAGFHPALYVGSWSDWITNPDRPVATGP
jgi:thiosulfate/3-mercaptopyruvate sulfurtransferase